MSATPFNKYRAAMEVLQRGRDSMIDALTDEILDQPDDFPHSGFLFNEFLEMQGTRVHFLMLLMSQLEMSAEQFDERAENREMFESEVMTATPEVEMREIEPPVEPPVKKRRSRRKSSDKAPPEGSPEEA
ncbi:MAG: hypothetical protein SFX72_07905 [Isosphaeraceae bacterium]|nr:hypothetical protein [Isosphaeraceae bacterium]